MLPRWVGSQSSAFAVAVAVAVAVASAEWRVSRYLVQVVHCVALRAQVCSQCGGDGVARLLVAEMAADPAPEQRHGEERRSVLGVDARHGARARLRAMGTRIFCHRPAASSSGVRCQISRPSPRPAHELATPASIANTPRPPIDHGPADCQAGAQCRPPGKEGQGDAPRQGRHRLARQAATGAQAEDEGPVGGEAGQDAAQQVEARADHPGQAEGTAQRCRGLEAGSAAAQPCRPRRRRQIRRCHSHSSPEARGPCQGLEGRERGQGEEGHRAHLPAGRRRQQVLPHRQGRPCRRHKGQGQGQDWLCSDRCSENT